MTEIREQRRHPRHEVVLEATVSSLDGRELFKGKVRNLSLGGAFIETDRAVREDDEIWYSKVALRMWLPVKPGQFYAIGCSAVVVWSSDAEPELAKGRTGFGVQLTGLGPGETEVLTGFLERRTV